MLITLAAGAGAFILFVAIWRYWVKVHSPDLGNMSRQWVVEQSAQPPSD